MTPGEQQLKADVDRLAFVVAQLYSRVRTLEKAQGITPLSDPAEELTGHTFHTRKQ